MERIALKPGAVTLAELRAVWRGAPVALDDSAWAAVMEPPLTMIAQPVHELGAKAAQVLLDILGGAAPAREMHTLRSRLIQRASVAAPREG